MKTRRYIVTTPSDDGTFLKGDRIFFRRDGAIGCEEVDGWIEPEDVEERTIGMEYEPMVEYEEQWERDELGRMDTINEIANDLLGW
jgi:hypothetical protein